ncbi:hypothetical protein CWI38_2493p0010, partial [Hamiltosporidium tvaerminnensis]
KTRCTSKKQTKRNNELNTAEVLRTVQAVKPRVRGRDLGDTPHEQTVSLNSKNLTTCQKRNTIIHPKADSSSFLSDHTNNTQDNIFQKSRAGKNVLPSVIEKAHLKKGKDTTQITHMNNKLTSSSNKLTRKILSRLRIKVLIRTVPKQNTLRGGTDKPYRKRSLETTNSEIGEDQVKKINYQADIKETISDKSESSPIKLTAEHLAHLTQGKSPFTYARHLVVNMEFLSNTVLEVICKGIFRMLGAKHLINSPEVDSNGLFKISKLFTRMKKIKDRQGNKNDKLRIGYINVGGLSDNRIFKINNLIQGHMLDILGVAETWRDNITPLLRGYKVLNSKKSVQVRDRYSNKEGIIVLGRDTIVSEAIDNITDEGVSIKVNDQIFIFIYRPPKSTEFNIVKPTLNQYLYKRLYILGEYNLEQHKTLEQQILDNHAMYGLSEIDILTNTYKHNNKESKPDKIFTNTIVDIKISTIVDKSQTLDIKTDRNTKKRKLTNITNKIEILIKKNANIMRTLNINDCCAALHNIILSGVYKPRIRKNSPLERARHNNPILFERLCKEVKRLTKNLPDTDTRDLKVEHIGLEASQLEAIM